MYHFNRTVKGPLNIILKEDHVGQNWHTVSRSMASKICNNALWKTAVITTESSIPFVRKVYLKRLHPSNPRFAEKKALSLFINIPDIQARAVRPKNEQLVSDFIAAAMIFIRIPHVISRC